jgi:hypothetical protein
MFGPQNPLIFPSTKLRTTLDSLGCMVEVQRLFTKAHRLGVLQRVWRKIRRSPNHLLDLAKIHKDFRITNAHYKGIESVPIDRIIGSEGRSKDFDANFYPVSEHNRERWTRIAAARLMNVVLPPPELIKIEGYYFVRDGHHRISVAKILGEKHIDGEITEWQIDGSHSQQICGNPGNTMAMEAQICLVR